MPGAGLWQWDLKREWMLLLEVVGGGGAGVRRQDDLVLVCGGGAPGWISWNEEFSQELICDGRASCAKSSV